MKILILLILLSSCCFSQTTSAEILFDQSGNVIFATDKARTEIQNCTSIIRGLTNKPYLRFNDSLYEKYYKRMVKINGKIGFTSPQGMNRREHYKLNGIQGAWDLSVVGVKKNNIEKVKSDIIEVYGDSLARYKHSIDTWNWGTAEVVQFVPLRFDSFRKSQIDSIITDPSSWKIDKKDLNANISVGKAQWLKRK